jgi:ribose 5-phosphate isomerase B
MNSKKLFIASDHAGFELKTELLEYAKQSGLEIEDCGCYSKDSVDYPDYAKLVAQKVLENSTEGILICGSGIGMDIAANRHKGIRAALIYEPELAVLSRTHNDANILVLGARFTDKYKAKKILEAWLQSSFEAGRHKERVDKLDS